MSKHERSFEKAFSEEAASLKQPQLKPFETPKGYVPPTIGEQFRYVRAIVCMSIIKTPTVVHCSLPTPAGNLRRDYPIRLPCRHTPAILTPIPASAPCFWLASQPGGT